MNLTPDNKYQKLKPVINYISIQIQKSMKPKFCLWYMLLAITFICQEVVGQEVKFTLSGYVKDAESGEELIGAAIYVAELSTGVSTNEYGFFSLTLPKGNYAILVSYIGYQQKKQQYVFDKNQAINFELFPEGAVLEEVVISSKKETANVEDVEMSQINLQVKQIKKMPALLGEVDIIKAIQLLPGVATVGEGTSGFYVRGGGVDQNLILLDEAPVFNASHLLGFFSVFNPDAIKDLQLYKGGMPANYGGRLSSVLDIRMKEGNSKKFEGSAGIGSISSRLTLEVPLAKDKSSLMISGRRTYVDLFLKLSSDTLVRQSQLYFYDLNTKFNIRLNEKNRIFLSGYFGRDIFGQQTLFSTNWGNATGTFRWNHVYNEKLFSNLTLFYSHYDYTLGDPQGADAFEWNSDLDDLSAKLDYTYFLNPENTFKFGIQSTRHKINPGLVKGIGSGSIFSELNLEDSKSLEHAVYLSNKQKFGDKLTALYGLRFSLFQNMGAAKVVEYNAKYEPVDSVFYSKGKIFNSYAGFEPRIGLRFSLDERSSIKLSYNRTYQYLQLASNTTSSSPLDIWFPASPNVKPQRADQVAAGYFRNFNNNALETSLEIYYKKLNNSIDFRDHAELLLNEFLEGELRFGKGRAYGMELLVKKQTGKLTGWIGYTLSKSERIIPEINDGKYYPLKYDKTHDVSVVASYDLSDRFNLSANWVFSTGSAVTMPTGRYEYYGMIVPVYSSRNGDRLPAYHRMDISATWKMKKKWFKRVERELLISIYNVYNRKNAYSINFRQDEENPNVTLAEKTYLFGIIPSITYNFKF